MRNRRVKVRYRAEKRKLRRTDRKMSIHAVNQGAFREAHRKRRGRAKDSLATPSTRPCHIVSLRNREGSKKVLVHMTKGIDIFTTTMMILTYLKSKRIIKKPRDLEVAEILIGRGFFRSLILGSSRKDLIRDSYLTLRLLGLSPEVINCMPHSIGYVGFEGEELVRIPIERIANGETVKQRSRGVLRRNLEAARTRSIYCENDGNFLRHRFFDIYPGIPIVEISDRKYTINLPVDEDIDMDIVRGRPYRREVSIDVTDCPQGWYMRISGDVTRFEDFGIRKKIGGEQKAAKSLYSTNVRYTQEVAFFVSEAMIEAGIPFKI